ncbi:TIGR03747 family integrating conjugative element membrane protein [Providencia rettgeri]|uniref:TIGR03747 family integrating conjugative element membrane protein n=1 Tax=Providencia rettgeri TaxID=587 RepID=UPI00200A3331|nr:TIGR03747 family integrating conjugative element membrane protein [Providencia rettgeri]UPQ40169.1 TIGR03747 family integrating conjugative element membrane protein [Providencia rettgeri]
MTQNDSQKDAPRHPVKEPGLLAKVVWHWPWAILGVLLLSWLCSLVIEWIGIAFFWPTEGAEHSRQVMLTERGYLSEGFRQSLLMSSPVKWLDHRITLVYQWLFVDSGLAMTLQNAYQAQSVSTNAIARELNSWSGWLLFELREYLLAIVWVTLTFLIRVTILVLSLPLFVLILIVAAVEGLARRDLRRYGAGYESSFVYHHAKRFVKPAFFIPCMIYLSFPSAIYPNIVLLPAAILLGVSVTVTMASFKKYL